MYAQNPKHTKIINYQHYLGLDNRAHAERALKPHLNLYLSLSLSLKLTKSFLSLVLSLSLTSTAYVFIFQSSLYTHQTMQISLTISPAEIPSLSPFFKPISQPPTIPRPTHKISVTTHNKPVNALKKGGFVSLIDRAIEEEEFRKARAEVHRKGVDLEGYSIEGISIGGHETCVIIPELKSAFDIGRCPSRAVHQNFCFITHAHLDHIGGLPMYVATRALYNLKPPTVFVPPCIKEDVEKLFDIHRAMSQVELNLDLVALDVGETYEMRNNLVVRPFKTHHVIPSQGYVIYSVRNKLKKQYTHLKGKQIEKLKKSGVEITDIILSPEVAFTGDTRSDFMLDPRNADALRAKILITEATFLDEGLSIEHARQHGHTHLSEIIQHAQWIRNKAILLTHFSSRYNIEEIRQAVSKLQSKVSAKVVPLTEGFKSMYS